MSDPLSGRQRRDLRGRGHHLKPTAIIGKEGLSDGLLKSLEVALATNDLIKVKLLDTTGIDRREFAEELAQALGGQVAQVLGKTMLIYRKVKPPKPEPEPETSTED